MPPKTNGDELGGKVLSQDVVSLLLAANGVFTVSKKSYEVMSALDGVRTPSSFEHQFRAILARAKDLKKRIDDGEQFVPVTPSKKRAAPADKATPVKKAKKTTDQATPKATPKTTPKKPVATPKPKSKSSDMLTPEEDDDLGGGYFAEAYQSVKKIKQEDGENDEVFGNSGWTSVN